MNNEKWTDAMPRGAETMPSEKRGKAEAGREKSEEVTIGFV